MFYDWFEKKLKRKKNDDIEEKTYDINMFFDV